MNSERTTTNKTYALVYVYSGPSRPSLHWPELVRLLPPACYGDLDARTIPDNAIIVFIDGLFFHMPAVTHYELLKLLTAERTVIGAGSMGAIRAIELRCLGMIGLGSIYQHYLRGALTDDSELAEAVCPYTYQALTLPLVRIRRALALASRVGINDQLLDKALSLASSIHFLERSLEKVLETWSRKLGLFESHTLVQFLRSPESDIKAHDAYRAIATAIKAVQAGHLDLPVAPLDDIYISKGGK